MVLDGVPIECDLAEEAVALSCALRRLRPRRTVPPVTQLDRIEHLLGEILTILKQERAHMTVIDDALADLQTKLTAETNASAAIEQLLTSVNDQLKAALALGDPTKIASQISAISTSLDTNTKALVAATVANTPAAPATP